MSGDWSTVDPAKLFLVECAALFGGAAAAFAWWMFWPYLVAAVRYLARRGWRRSRPAPPVVAVVPTPGIGDEPTVQVERDVVVGRHRQVDVWEKPAGEDEPAPFYTDVTARLHVDLDAIEAAFYDAAIALAGEWDALWRDAGLDEAPLPRLVTPAPVCDEALLGGAA